MSGQPVVFINGLWIHSSAWEPWATLYRREGYEPILAGWPGDGPTVDDRGHSLVIDSRWREVADFTIGWVNAHQTPGLTNIPGAQS